MKTKFSRILGVALTVAMIASLFVFAAPAAAQPGKGMWDTQAMPDNTDLVVETGSDVGDIAVSGDGTIYVLNNDPGNVSAGLAYPADTVLKSTDGGQSFNVCTAITGVAANGLFANSIAVAPDDSDAVMVTDNVTAFVSTDAGTTWTALPAKNTAGDIMDCDVSPAVTGAIVDRHYVIAVADPVAASTTGRAEIYGPGATWTVIATPNGGAPAGDYMACKFSPSYVGDRYLALVWNGIAVNQTNLSIIGEPGEAAENEVRTSEVLTAAAPAGSADYDSVSDGHQAANTQVACDIALPDDWDPSLSAGEVTYVSIGTSVAAIAAQATPGRGGATASTSGHACDDVYRIDAGVAVDMDGSNQVPVHSIAYSGTIDDGTLFLGTRLDPNVRYTLNPTSMAPTWKTTDKAPTGDNLAAAAREARTRVVVAPNGDIYAGTCDAWTAAGAAANRRSAFSVSKDAGVSFNQTALIDLGVAGNDVDTVNSVMLTPDGETLFMASDDGTDLSLWKSETPTDSDTWERICTRTAGGPGLIRLAPDYGDNPSVFWFNQAARNLWVSHDGGAVFYNRTPPAIPQDMVAQSGGTAGVLYMATAGGTTIYRSDNGGNHFAEGPVDAEAGVIISLAMAPSYPAPAEAGHLLVGGTGAVAYSTDSGMTFTQITGGLAGASTYLVCADEGYATAGSDGENMIYCGDSLAAGTANTFRYEIGVSSQFDDMLSAAVAATDEVVGLGINNGVLYSLSAAVWGVERTLYPLDPLGTIIWDTGVTGLVAPGAFAVAGSPNILTVAGNILYFPDRTVFTPVLWALEDTTATVIPVINVPADGASIAVDPVTGRGTQTTVTWDAIGSGGGLVNRYELEAATPATGWIGTTRAFANIGTLVGEPTAPSLTVGDAVTGAATGSLPTWAANETYMLRVRARSVVNQPSNAALTIVAGQLRSHWSDPITVYIQAGGLVTEPQYGPQLQGPIHGATDVSLNPGFSWAPISGATLYRFWLATDSGLTQTVEGTPVDVTDPACQVPAGTLEYDTVYFWGVKAIEPTESPLSIGTFTTMAEEIVEEVEEPTTPAYMWAIIIIGAVLMIAVIMLIMKTRRVA